MHFQARGQVIAPSQNEGSTQLCSNILMLRRLAPWSPTNLVCELDGKMVRASILCEMFRASISLLYHWNLYRKNLEC